MSIPPSPALLNARADEAAGRLAEARAGYRAVMDAEPDNAVAAYRLGLVCRRLNLLGEALPWLQKALQLSNHPEVAVDFADALQAAGQWEPAAAIYALASRLAPDLVDAAFGRAVCLHRLGRLEEAVVAYRLVLSRYPDTAAASENAGLALIALNRHHEAAGLLAEGTHHNPDNAGLWRQRQRAAVLAGEHEAAVTAGRRLLALVPDDAAGYALLCTGLDGAGRQDAAADAGGRALRVTADIHDPAMVTVACTLADIERRRGRTTAALAQLRIALTRDPLRVQGWWQLGRLWLDLENPLSAAQAYRRALALSPGDADRLLDLATALSRADDIDGAIAVYRRVAVCDPGNALALGHWVELRLKACDWPGIDPLIDRLLTAVRDDGRVAPPFGFLSLPGATATDQRIVAERWTALKTGGVKPVLRPSVETGDGRLRIGYLSSDFREHAISHLMVGLLEAHDRERFAVTAYSIGHDDGSPMRARVMAGVERFVDLRGMDDAAAARRIAADSIDILVDVNAYTAFARTAIVAARPAPVQVNWLGYPGTMGAAFIDYIIADPVVIPPGTEGDYSETVVRLPHCYQANDDKRPIADLPLNRAGAGLPERGFVFCCFNNLHKITPAVFARWLDLLRAVPDSVLWLLQGHPLAVANLRQTAADGGIDPTRLVFAPPKPAAEHLARHRLADLFLDTLPYNAHTTASDALWAGLPLVTRRGDTFAGRVAASLLTAAGLPELITESAEDYTALALHLAREPAALTAVRATLAAHRRTCPLFDTAGFARAMEAAFVKMTAR